MSYENLAPTDSQQSLHRRPPFFFREEYSNLVVKGNFMTLAAKPVLVDDGEWLAHQGTAFLSLKLRLYQCLSLCQSLSNFDYWME
jgi:hypothetical protein